MSRLDSFIRRMMAQRDLINEAAAMIAEVPGVVFELGLGNGRTFDHLRERLPGREIFVFDRRVAAHPSSVPDAGHMILGEVGETLPAAVARHRGRVAMVHNDLGDGTPENTAAIRTMLEGALAPALAPGALVLSNAPLIIEGTRELALPEGIATGRYFLYRRQDARG
ncbi:MAG: hypothetical protein GC150_00845 [Rhizobiales bacterium]|nr:hypothetical protein [Hyphomicrobiales bacterium]